VLLDETRELAWPVRGRALEHQVLEEVRDAGGAACLVARADPVPHLERDDRISVVFLQEHAQTVFEGGRKHAVAVLRGSAGGQDEQKRRDEPEPDRVDWAHRPDYTGWCIIRVLCGSALRCSPRSSSRRRPPRSRAPSRWLPSSSAPRRPSC